VAPACVDVCVPTCVRNVISMVPACVDIYIGAYLLSVSWGTCQVHGSPFKVTVMSGSDPSKVVVSGAGLSGGTIGQDFSFTVDTRRSGSGQFIRS